MNNSFTGAFLLPQCRRMRFWSALHFGMPLMHDLTIFD